MVFGLTSTVGNETHVNATVLAVEMFTRVKRVSAVFFASIAVIRCRSVCMSGRPKPTSA